MNFAGNSSRDAEYLREMSFKWTFRNEGKVKSQEKRRKSGYVDASIENLLFVKDSIIWLRTTFKAQELKKGSFSTADSWLPGPLGLPCPMCRICSVSRFDRRCLDLLLIYIYNSDSEGVWLY